MTGVRSSVLVEASLQKKLNNSSELFKAEVYFFTRQLKEHGRSALNTPGYSLAVPVEPTKGAYEHMHVEVKLRGSWTPYLITVPQPDTFVLYDG